MLKALGVFWMNYGEVIIAISAAITLLGVVFTFFKNNSISTRAVDRTGEAEKTLSAEHTALSAKQEIVLERTADSKATLLRLQDTLSATDKRLIEAEAERKVRYATLSDAQRRLVDSAENMGRFSEEFSKLVKENVELRQENQALRQHIELLTQERQLGEPSWEEPEQ